MKPSKKIIWIDDSPNRLSTANAVGAIFINVNGKDPAPEIQVLLKGPQPSLVILDHILDKTTTENPIFQKGSTIAEAIKEKWPFCPVVGITNIDNLGQIDLRTKATYDILFPFYDFSKYIDRLEEIRKGFTLIIRTQSKTANSLIQLLKSPDDDIERLIAALPGDFKEKEFAKDASVASRFYRWVQDYLMARPGFLYDTLWTATFFGLTELGFKKIVGEFEKGRYAGIFARQNDTRWWSSRLSWLLYKLCIPQAQEMSWHTGRRLPGIKKQHFSKCYACNDHSPPETVAYVDAASSERHAMHLTCTILHPHHKRELYFEDIRIMQGK